MGSASRLADARDVWGDGARVAANERSQQDRRWCRPHGPRPRGFAPTPLRPPPAEVPGGKSQVPLSRACFLLGSESSFPLAAFQMLFIAQHPGENSLVPASAQTCRALSFPELGVGWGTPYPHPRQASNSKWSLRDLGWAENADGFEGGQLRDSLEESGGQKAAMSAQMPFPRLKSRAGAVSSFEIKPLHVCFFEGTINFSPATV